MQCPMKFTESREQHDRTKRLESVRKDVECFFERLKRRFGLLRDSIEYQSQSAIDNAFFSCCVLHNMLHEYDHMDEWAVELDELAAGGIPLNDAMIHPYVEAEAQQVEEGHTELRDKLITHYIVTRERGETTWLRS